MSFRKLTLALALVAVSAVSIAYAQPRCSEIILPDGTKLHCDVVNGTKVYVDDDGTVYNLTSTGIGDFEIVSTDGETCQAVLKPTDIVITSTEPTLGTVTTRLDASRASTNSTIKAVNPGVSFPANEDLYFFATATVSANPGRVYQSTREVHLTATVNSFNPHRNETFKSPNPVDFEDVNAPGAVAFTLNSIGVTLTGNDVVGCKSVAPPPQTRLHCIVVDGRKVYVDDAGNVYDLTSEGTGDFTVVESGTSPCNSTLEPTSIKITSKNAALGTVTTSLDPTRRSTNSTIQSAADASEFPATENIYFYAQAELSSKPGTIYRSVKEVHLQATVNSFAPHEGETFKNVEEVEFYDEREPDRIAFTLREIQVTLK